PAPVCLVVRRRPAVRPAEPPASAPSPRPPGRRVGRLPPVMVMVAFLVVPIRFRPVRPRVAILAAWAAFPVTVPILAAWAAFRARPIRFRSAACPVAAILAAWVAFPAMVPILAGSAAFLVTAPIRFLLGVSRVVPGASAVRAARVTPEAAASAGRALERTSWATLPAMARSSVPTE
ncbi:MAG: hypothetical protein WB800_34230, partial [Streptosporangiaceae bacterium]